MIKNCLNCNSLLPIDSCSYRRKYCSKLCQNKCCWKQWKLRYPDKWQKHQGKRRHYIQHGTPIWKMKDKNKTCKLCLTADNLVVHHIQPKECGGSNDFSNLVVICYSCHRLIHKKIAILIGQLFDFKKLFPELF